MDISSALLEQCCTQVARTVQETQIHLYRKKLYIARVKARAIVNAGSDKKPRYHLFALQKYILMLPTAIKTGEEASRKPPGSYNLYQERMKGMNVI